MHEAGPVRMAIASVVDGWEPDRSRGHLLLDVADPTRAHADAVAFYAQVILADRGLPGVTFEVRVRDMTCALCGATTLPVAADPACPACGAPLPRRDGPAIICHEAGPSTGPSGPATGVAGCA